MRRMLPSPLQSLWAFLGYVVVIGTPLWKIIAWLGDVNFVMDYAGPFLNALNTAPGTVSMMLVGFGLLAWANHKERLTPATQVEAATPDELLQLRTRLGEVEQEREQAQTDKRALQQELEQTRNALEQARADGGRFGAHTIEQEDAQDVIQRLQAEVEQLKAWPDDEELKSECFQVSAAYYQFVRDHGSTEREDYLDPEVMRRNDEVMLEYEESLGGKVNGLLRKLQRRGWWQPETVESKKRKHIEDPGFLSDVQDIARELNAIGHEH